MASIQPAVDASAAFLTQPPACNNYPLGIDAEKALSLKEISDLAKAVHDDIFSQGKIYNLWHERIYASMQLSRDLLQFAPEWYKKWDQFKSGNDPTELANYALFHKSAFYDAFTECETASCVVDEYCTKVAASPQFMANSNIYEQVTMRCQDEGWRFQNFIFDKDFSHFEFDFVPAKFKDCGAGDLN